MENNAIHTGVYSSIGTQNQDDMITKIIHSKDFITRLIWPTNKRQLRITEIVEMTRMDGRCILNIGIRESTSYLQRRLHVDISSGAPTLEQVADCVYGSGADADQQMIIYGGNFNIQYTYHFGNKYLVADLVALARANGIPLSLVHLEDRTGLDDEGLYYHLIHSAFSPQRLKSATFPTRRQILEREFWSAYYYMFYDEGAPAVKNLETLLFSRWETGYPIGGLRTNTTWNDEGLFMYVEGRPDDNDMRYLKENVSLLQSKYLGCPIDIDTGDKVVISVRLLDLPMKHLIDMTPEQKCFYGGYVYDQEFPFYNKVREVLEHKEVNKD